MDYCVAIQILDKGLLDLALQTNLLTPVVDEVDIPYVRIQETRIPVSTETRRICKTVAVAYKLDQYKNKYYGLHLKEDVQTWLDLLVEEKEFVNVT